MENFLNTVRDKQEPEGSCIIKIDLQIDKTKDMDSTGNLQLAGQSMTKDKVFMDETGMQHWYSINKVPIKGQCDGIRGVVTVLKNIDAEKQLQKQRETFVATLGHDLKNPTVAQMRGLELLLRGDFGEITDEQRNIVEMILDSCKYMNGMLATMLATYRDEDGNAKLKFKDFPLSDLVRECVTEMKYVALEKGVLLNIRDDFGERCVQADRVQIKRVIMNLISNGIKYAYKNTELNIFITPKGKNVNFYFKNKSPYIPPENQKKIFGQYVTFADTYKEMGIGLGLYASQKIVEGHNGKIYLKSHRDDTNEFGFIIPVKNSVEM